MQLVKEIAVVYSDSYAVKCISMEDTSNFHYYMDYNFDQVIYLWIACDIPIFETK